MRLSGVLVVLALLLGSAGCSSEAGRDAGSTPSATASSSASPTVAGRPVTLDLTEPATRASLGIADGEANAEVLAPHGGQLAVRLVTGDREATVAADTVRSTTPDLAPDGPPESTVVERNGTEPDLRAALEDQADALGLSSDQVAGLFGRSDVAEVEARSGRYYALTVSVTPAESGRPVRLSYLIAYR